MLTIGAMGGASLVYYQHLANREDYFLKSERAPAGLWHGEGAKALGLSGEVKTEHFTALFEGFHPHEEGKKLVQNAGKMTGDRPRQPGWDLTLSAPKSVTLARALGDEKVKSLIENAHNEAVRSVIPFFEEHSITRSGKGGYIKEQAKICVAVYQHSTARAVNKSTLPDPQLHSHMVVFNVGVKKDGKTGSLESRDPYYKLQLAGGALYRAELAMRLEIYGFQIERTEEAFEIKGISKELCKELSKRTEQIQNATQAARTYKERDFLKASARERKRAYPQDELEAHWQRFGQEYHVNANSIRSLLNHSEPKDARVLQVEKREGTERALEKLLQQHGIFTKYELLTAIAVEMQARGAGANAARDATKELLHSKRLVEVGKQKDGQVLYTTEQFKSASEERRLQQEEYQRLLREEEQQRQRRQQQELSLRLHL